jgi:hypothetical protein
MRIRSLLLPTSAALAAALAPLVAAAQSAGDLRVELNQRLTEHAYLVAAVTGAALGGRPQEAKSATAALDANSVDLARAIGAVYGADAGKSFLELWRQHVVFLIDYTGATARKSARMQDDAVQNLLGYAEDFAAFLSAANPHLPEAAVAELLRTHVRGLTSVVDAQARADHVSAYAKLREVAAHMQSIGDPLAAAIAKQFPEKSGAEGCR